MGRAKNSQTKHDQANLENSSIVKHYSQLKGEKDVNHARKYNEKLPLSDAGKARLAHYLEKGICTKGPNGEIIVDEAKLAEHTQNKIKIQFKIQESDIAEIDEATRTIKKI